MVVVVGPGTAIAERWWRTPSGQFVGGEAAVVVFIELPEHLRCGDYFGGREGAVVVGVEERIWP